MNEYLNAQNKTNEIIINDILNADELDRFSKADSRWADNRKEGGLSKRQVKKGDIYQFEFGKGYKPEIAYEHRGLVIGVRKKILYVLPIFSYDAQKYPDVYHPEDFPESQSDFFLLKNIEFPFIKRDSVLKLNDLRTVSVNRILYRQPGCLDVKSDTYRRIENLAFLKLFPGFHHDLLSDQQQINTLNRRIKELEEKQSLIEKKEKTAVQAVIAAYRKIQMSDSDILAEIMKQFSLTEEEAQNYMLQETA